MDETQKLEQYENRLIESIDSLRSKSNAPVFTRAHESALTLRSVCRLIDTKAETNRTAADALHAARQHCTALYKLLGDKTDADHPVAAPQMIDAALAQLDTACKQRTRNQTLIDPLAISAIKTVTQTLTRMRSSL